MGKKVQLYEIAEQITNIASQLEVKDKITYHSEAVLFFCRDEYTLSVGTAMFPISAEEVDNHVKITYYPVIAFCNDWTDEKKPVGFLKLSEKIETMIFSRKAALNHLRRLKNALYVPKEFVLTI
jgi:hypothetical protein